jgi:hypothetical protein
VPTSRGSASSKPSIIGVERALSRSGRLNVSVATLSEISSISCFSNWMLLPKANQQPRCGRSVSGGRGAGLVGARVAQGPYDVARRASCAPLSCASTNSARRPQTNAPLTLLPFELILGRTSLERLPLHEALCLLRRPALSICDDQGRCQVFKRPERPRAFLCLQG